jgi:2-polyprenyl-3-methyl-5-hydroxy-6-metoxy-1,4-benzoquinol methylase
VVCGAFPDVLATEQFDRFDVVFMNDVLEHMADPWGALARLESPCRTALSRSLPVPRLGHS